MGKKYSEYFVIDENYYPEINPDSVKNDNKMWQKTFPHATMVSLLDSLELMLSREKSELKKGIWIEGAYGSGKSRVIWAVKNLLECEPKEFEDYFERYDSLRKKPDLKEKLLADKKKKIVTAFRYGSGDIENINKLVWVVFETLTKVLKKNKLDYRGGDTLRGKIADWLEDESNRKVFEIYKESPQFRSLGSFNGKTVDDIVAQLRNENASADALISDILRLGEEKGITAFEITMDDLKAWITDVIKINNIDSLVFMWDEFSAFFKNNKNSFDIFQKLVELSNNVPFYMIIVTHMAGSVVSAGEQGTFKSLYDRFVHKEIDMPDNVAFDLIHNALNIKEDSKAEYELFISEKISEVASAAKAVCEYAKIDKTVMDGIMPIHPMSALLLKYIAKHFAANQRSMFNFIKNSDSDNLQAFQWFISNKSPELGEILTVDYLWNFFYEKGSDENSDSKGRSNLDNAIATILDTYPANEAKLNEEERRVLKVVLMFQAISRKLNNAVELLRPNAKNISFAFQGDEDIDGLRAINIIKNQLVQKKILFIDNSGSVEEFAAAAVAGDQVQIDIIKERLRKEVSTSKLVQDGELEQAFTFDSAIRARYDISTATSTNLHLVVGKINTTRKYENRYKMDAVVCIARNDSEQQLLRNKIAEIKEKPDCENIVFIDATGNQFGTDNFEKWLEAAAQEEYWRNKDPKLADDKHKDVKHILNDWKSSLIGGTFVIYQGSKRENAGGMTSAKDTLASLVVKKYPLSFDNCSVTDQFFTNPNYKDAVKRGIEIAKNPDFHSCGIFLEKCVRGMIGNVLGVNDYQNVMPKEAISRLKVIIDEYINSCFTNDVRIPISDVFEKLIDEGFLPCAMYAYLTGFLLSNYADGAFRYSVGLAGDDGGIMNAEKLAEFMSNYIKYKIVGGKYKEAYIEIMTEGQKAFVDFSVDAFEIPDNLSVEMAAARVRVRLKDIGFPVWCYKTIDTNNLQKFLDLLISITSTNAGTNVPESANEFGKLLIKIPAASSCLKELITEENGVKAMKEYLLSFEDGGIPNAAQQIGIIDMIGDVKRQIGSGEAAWLWDKTTGDEELHKLLIEYNIILESNKFIAKSVSFGGCLSNWEEYAKNIKIPSSVLSQEVTGAGSFISILKEIAVNRDLPYERHENFLKMLKESAGMVQGFKEEAYNVFCSEYSDHMNGFGETEKRKLYAQLPTTSFTDSKSEYEKSITQIAQKIRKELAAFQLLEKWTMQAGVLKPYEWSSVHRTPISVMVPKGEEERARILFDAISKSSPDEYDVKRALEYIDTKPDFLHQLEDKGLIDAAFKKFILKRYAAILVDVDEVRTYLESHVSEDAYHWESSKNVGEAIAKFARNKYLNGANQPVMDKINDMTSEQAKAYLKSLVENDVNVGISILEDKE